MIPTKITRPAFPPGYVSRPVRLLTWEWVAAQLTESLHYWLSSTRPDGRPHVVPRWGVYVEGRFYYDGSPETRHARNLLSNPNAALHLESGEQVIILEGISAAAPKPDRELGRRLSKGFRAKDGPLGYSPRPNQWDHGGLFVLTPRQCIAWTSFTQDPTKFIFEPV